MLKLFRWPLTADWASAATVALISALVGDQARTGMSLVQWIGGIAAILGAIAWAVIIRIARAESAA